MNAVIAGLLALSIVLIQCLIGGTRLVFCLPAYAVLALAALLAIGGVGRERVRADGTCLAVSAVFFAYVLARAAGSPWGYLWWGDFYMVIACLTAYALTVFRVPGTSARSAIVAVLLALALAEFFIGLRQFTRGDDWMPFGFVRAASGTRASGMFISSIHLAGYLEAVGAFALSLAVWSRWAGWARALAGYAAVLCYAGVAITGSRGGYGSSVAALGAFAVLSLVVAKRARPRRFRSIIVGAGLAGVLVLAGALALMRQSTMIRERLALIGQKDVRIYNWQAALDQFRTAPLFGTGAGTHVYYGRLFRREAIQADPIHAHSDYLELLAEYGIIGAAGMAALLFVHLRRGLRTFSYITTANFANLAPYEPARSDALALVIGALSAVAAYLAHSIVDFNLHIPGNALTFAFIFGILASPHGEAAVKPAAAPSWPTRLLLPALGVWMAVAGLPKWRSELWCERARQALRSGKYAAAIELAGRALTLDQRNPDLYFHLGEAHRNLARTATNRDEKRHQLDDAIAAYRHSLAIFPFDEHVLVRMGQALDERENFAEARAAYETAIQHDPRLGVVHAYYARHLARVGRTDEATDERHEAERLSAHNLRQILGDTFLDEPDQPASNQ